MPRRPRRPSMSGYYHFMNRGVNKRYLFHRPEDYKFYKLLLNDYKERFNIEIIHYCLMTNHTHCVLKSPDLQSLSHFAHYIHRRYVYYYCKTYKWSEQLFRSRFLSIPIENDAYLMECGRYIERNPLDAKLVNDPKDYLHSSFNYYAYAKPDSLITESPLYQELGKTKEERMLIYRFNVLHNRDYELEKNKSLRRFTKKVELVQPVPF